MKNILPISLLLSTLVSCNQNNKTEIQQNDTVKIELIPHEIVNGEVEYIKANKTRYISKIVLKEPINIDEIKLKQLLSFYYDSINNLDGEPNFIDIKIYESTDHLNSKYGQWTAWLNKTPNQNSPEYNFHIEKKKTIDETKNSKLNETTRKKIWDEILEIDLEAENKAQLKYPDNFGKQLDYENELREKLSKKLIKNYNITNDELQNIKNEGRDKNWVIK